MLKEIDFAGVNSVFLIGMSGDQPVPFHGVSNPKVNADKVLSFDITNSGRVKVDLLKVKAFASMNKGLYLYF